MNKFFLLVAVSCLPIVSHATENKSNSKSSLLLGAGLGVASLPHYPGSDENDDYFLPLPYIDFRSDRLSVNDKGVHAELINANIIQLDFDITGSFPVSSDDNTARNGMPDLGFFVEIGPEVSLRLIQKQNYYISIDIPVRASFELLGEDKTFDDKFVQDAGYLLEPRLHYEAKNGSLSYDFDIGFLWADETYQSKFFSVNQEFVTNERAFYKARSGLMGHRLSSTVKYETDNWLLLSYVKYIDLSQGKNELSPLIKKDDYLLGGVGFVRKFKIW
jgi:outer membrane scaffolding protein for murein synthesis (MipA/OmpV family)